MPVAEALSDKIFELNDNLSKFIQQDEYLKQELKEYSQTLSQGLARDTLAYFIFDRKTKNGKYVIDIYLNKNKNLSESDKKTLKGFKNSINSVFEVKKILKDGFELYNLVNEKEYTVKSLIKMINYKSIFQGNYLTCRIVPCENEYYLLVLNSILSSRDKHNAFKLAVSMQVENPQLLYKDNKKKLKELEKIVQTLGMQFVDFFKSSEVIAINTQINELLDAFNNFAENDKKTQNIEKLIEKPKEYKYFNIKGCSDPFDLTVERDETDIYDVGIVFDSELGLQVLPFYGTFKHIFEAEDYKSVEGYKNCINDYFTNGKVPPGVIQRIYENAPDKEKFLQIVKDSLEIKDSCSMEEILEDYKKDFTESKKYSSTTILYASEAFERLMGSSEEVQQERIVKAAKIGRNDPCICGSGKKYKKCCG